MRLLLFALLTVLYVSTLVSASNLKGSSFPVLQSLIKSKQSKSNKKTSISKSLKSSSIKSQSEKEKKNLARVDVNDSDDTINGSIDVTKAFASPLAKLLPFTTPCFLALSFLITWKVNFADKRILFIARVTFALYVIAAQLIVMHIEKKINKLNDLTPFIEDIQKTPHVPSKNDSPGDDSKGTEETIPTDNSITTKDYDLQQLKSYSSNLIMEGAMSAYMHFQQKSVKSLVFSQLMGLANLLNNNVIKIHLLGLKPIGALKRPFTSGMEQMLADAMKKFQERSAVGTATATNIEDVSSDPIEDDDETNTSISKNTVTVTSSDENDEEADNDSVTTSVDSIAMSSTTSTVMGESESESTTIITPDIETNSDDDEENENDSDNSEEEEEGEGEEEGNEEIGGDNITVSKSSLSAAESIQSAMNEAIDDLTQLKKE